MHYVLILFKINKTWCTHAGVMLTATFPFSFTWLECIIDDRAFYHGNIWYAILLICIYGIYQLIITKEKIIEEWRNCYITKKIDVFWKTLRKIFVVFNRWLIWQKLVIFEQLQLNFIVIMSPDICPCCGFISTLISIAIQYWWLDKMNSL